MQPIASKYTSQLERIKKTVRNAHDYFRHNYDSFNEFRKFVFDTSLSSDEITLLMTVGKPQLEFNVLEAYISRLLGEFSKQEPDIQVNADDETRADPMIIKVVEQHLRHTLTDIKNHHTRYETYKDLLSGGFSVLKVITKYANPMSMHQIIDFERCEPTLCGFDKIAKYSHKGDGRFCFELFPKDKEEFKEEYPDIPINTLNFRRDFAGFNWAYLNDNSQIIVVADYYEKKTKDETIVQVRDGDVMTMSKYKKMVDEWDDIAMPPSIVGKPRKTKIDTICRYRMIENQVIEYEETDFSHLPLVFIDGNSVMIKTPKNGNVRQVTRPYVYHAKGSQRLKNYAGISLANEIENTVQHKVMIAKEALPKEEEFLEAYKNVQKASSYVFNSVYEGNPEMPINNPIREVQRVPAPPEIAATFQSTDSLIQNVLGSYDASLGINNNQLSGIAIVEGASQSNATAMPYIVGYLQGWQRAAEIYVDLMPKYYTTPRTLPVVDEDGKRHAVMINQQNGMDMFYDSNTLNVVLKAGASFQVQKSRTIMMVKEMMGMSNLFADFISSKGLNFVLDNMDGRGIEQLKDMVKSWQDEQEQQKQHMMQMQEQEMQNNPAILKNKVDMQKIQNDAQKNQAQFAVDMAKIEQENIKTIASVKTNESTASVQLVKALTERHKTNAELQIKHLDMNHQHRHDYDKLAHEIHKSRHESNKVQDKRMQSE